MADTTALKNRIRAAIKANNNQEITGPVLQQSLLDIVDELNSGTEAEADTRQNADNALSQRINNETTRAQGIENDIISTSSRQASLLLTPGTYVNIDTVNKTVSIPRCNIVYAKTGFVLGEAVTLDFASDTGSDVKKVLYDISTGTASYVDRDVNIGSNKIILFSFGKANGNTDLHSTMYTINGNRPVANQNDIDIETTRAQGIENDIISTSSRQASLLLTPGTYVNIDTVNKTVSIPRCNIVYAKTGFVLGEAVTLNFASDTGTDIKEVLYDISTGTVSYIDRDTNIGNNKIILFSFGKANGNTDLHSTMYTINGNRPVANQNDINNALNECHIYRNIETNTDRLFRKIVTEGNYKANQAGFTDLPNSSNTFYCRVYHITPSLVLQIAIDSLTHTRYERVVDKNSYSLYNNQDWQICSNYLKEPTKYGQKISDITFDCSFIVPANNTNFINDTPFKKRCGIRVFQYADDYSYQIALDYNNVGTGSVYYRVIKISDKSVFMAWKPFTGVSSRQASLLLTPGTYVNIDTVNKTVSIPKCNVVYGEVGFVLGAAKTLNFASDTGSDVKKVLYDILTGTVSYVDRDVNIGSDKIILFSFGKAYGNTDLHSTMYTVNNVSYSEEFYNFHSLKVLGIGDSICNAVRNSRKSYLYYIAKQYKNDGVSSATISNKVTSVKNIPNQLLDENSYTPDIILAEGGINDYLQNATLGNIPSQAVNNDNDAQNLDRNTVCGAMSFLCYNMIKKFPDAKRFFILVHRMLNYPWTQNSAGYTQTELFEAIRKICELYSVKVIDIFNDSFINSRFSQYLSSTSLDGSTGPQNVTDYINLDGIHPLDRGYREGYAPIIKKHIYK